MIKRHRNADAIVRAKFDRMAGLEPVVEDIPVCESCALGKACGATRKLDVDGIIAVERGSNSGQCCLIWSDAEVSPSQKAILLLGSQRNHYA